MSIKDKWKKFKKEKEVDLGKKELVSKLNSYYDELSVLNKKLTTLLQSQDSNPLKITEILNRKDFIINQCLTIKKALENSGNSETEQTKEKTEQENVEAIEKMLEQESLNIELVKKNLNSLSEDIKKIKNAKQKLKGYSTSSSKQGNSLNKKA